MRLGCVLRTRTAMQKNYLDEGACVCVLTERVYLACILYTKRFLVAKLHSEQAKAYSHLKEV